MDALRASIVRLAVRHGIDVILLAECGIDEGDLKWALNAAGIGLDRKILADFADNDANAFKAIVDQVKNALEDKSKSKKKAA